MDGLIGLFYGFGIALTPENLLLGLVGCIVGMLVGVLPGVGQSTGMVLLIPITFTLPPTGAIIMLASIYYGAAYGGTITSVLLNVPGESETVVSTFEGYPMAQQGRGGVALSIAAIGSFVGGVVATVAMALLALPLSRLALKLTPPAHFALLVLGLALVAGLLGRSIIKGVVMIVFGLLLSQVGADQQMGIARLTFDFIGLYSGIPLLAIIMGFYGVSDVLLSVFRTSEYTGGPVKIKGLLPDREDFRKSVAPIARGTLVGFALGLLPGMVSAVSTFASYVIERRISKRPEQFGKGAIEGLAGPETANNAFANAAFLPLLTLGIPTSAALAILFSAFKIHGLAPGPLLFRDHPDIAWGVVASMITGNLILLILSLPLLRIWITMLRVPGPVLNALILVIASIGMYSVNNSTFDIILLSVFALVGAGLKVADYPLAPAVLAFVLGDKLENSLRQSLTIAQGDWSVFITDPVSVFLLIMTVIVLSWPLLRVKIR